MAKHVNKFGCEKCDEILRDCHTTIVKAFMQINDTFPECHISDGYRDKKRQDKYFREGKSKLKFPKSKHNFMDESGMPMSKAMDLFRLGSDGKAYFEPKYYKNIYDFSVDHDLGITWGGLWKTFKDYPHFEMES